MVRIMQGFSQLTEMWSRLDRRARTTIITVGVLCLGGLLLLTRLQSATTYAPLYSGLSAEDAGQIVEKLKAAKVPYRLTNGGASVEVPEERVYEQRIGLAREGLPASGQVGFEVFDKSSLPGTEFSNRVNYQRALQGELARTIGAMAEVQAARVHLVLPEESLFSEKSKASASVVLQAKPGADLNADMTAAVAHIVASAVQDIKADEVTVVDSSGRVLRGPQSDGKSGGLSANQFEIQQQYENRLCVSLQSMLDAVLGPNESVVRVQAQLDFDSQEVKDEKIMPVARGKGLVSSEKIREEQYRGGPGDTGGSVGLQPNLGLGTSASSARSGAYLNRDETRQYEYSRNTTSLVKAPGKVKTLTVAAVVSDTLGSAAEEQVKQVLTAAAGLDLERGDVLTVERMKIQAAEAAKNEEKQLADATRGQRRQSLLHTLLRSGLSLAAAGLIFASVIVATRQLRGATVTPVEDILPPESLPVAVDVPETPPAPADSPASSEPNLAMREQLRQIASQDTGAIADGLMSLLPGDRSVS